MLTYLTEILFVGDEDRCETLLRDMLPRCRPRVKELSLLCRLRHGDLFLLCRLCDELLSFWLRDDKLLLFCRSWEAELLVLCKLWVGEILLQPTVWDCALLCCSTKDGQLKHSFAILCCEEGTPPKTNSNKYWKYAYCQHSAFWNPKMLMTHSIINNIHVPILNNNFFCSSKHCFK